MTNFWLNGTKMTFLLPTFAYTSASVLVQPRAGFHLSRKAVKPDSHKICWPAVL